MQLVPIEDIDFFAKQSSGKLNMIISGMTALMNDNESKVEQLESQNWFQRMVRTVTGKNKATREEIQRNHDRINAYMSEALSELYNRNMIDHQIILSLGTQINELYADHIQLKQMLGAFALKLNEKIESVDNFHMLMEEISQGVYSSGHSLASICKVLSQLDHRTLSDSRKLDIVRRGLVSQGILSDEQAGLREYLSQVVEIPADEAGRIYLELGTLRGNFMADIMLAMMDDYHFLPDMARKMKNKPAMIADVMEAGRLDEGVTLSTCEIYDDFINSKIDTVNGLVQIETLNEDTETAEATTQVQEQDSPETLYELGNKYYCGNEVEQDYEQALDYYQKAAEQGYAPAQNALGYMFEHGEGVEKDYAHNNYKQAFVWYTKAAEQGYAEAQYNLGVLYENFGSDYLGIEIDRDTGYVEAAKWYKKAAEQGHAHAQFKLGFAYQYGCGVPKNHKKAASLYRKAAAQGDRDAEFWLNEPNWD